jgi:hypothetical protein
MVTLDASDLRFTCPVDVESPASPTSSPLAWCNASLSPFKDVKTTENPWDFQDPKMELLT